MLGFRVRILSTMMDFSMCWEKKASGWRAFSRSVAHPRPRVSWWNGVVSLWVGSGLESGEAKRKNLCRSPSISAYDKNHVTIWSIERISTRDRTYA